MIIRAAVSLLLLGAASCLTADPTAVNAMEDRADPEPPPCSEDRSNNAGVADRSADDNFFAGNPTGAWSVFGRTVRPENYFFVYMNDTNPGKKGSLLVHLHNRDGVEMDMVVRAFGSTDGLWEEFKGESWKQASTLERASLAKATLIRLAEQAAKECGGQMSSLADELATFELAFAAFDQREP